MGSWRGFLLSALIAFLLRACVAGNHALHLAENSYEEITILEIPRSCVGGNSEGVVPSFYYMASAGDVFLLDPPNHQVLHYGPKGLIEAYRLPAIGCFRGLDFDEDRDQLVLLERPIDARVNASIYTLDLATGTVEKVREIPFNAECATVITEAMPTRVYVPEDTIRLTSDGILVTYLGPQQALLTDNELVSVTPSCEPVSDDGSGCFSVLRSDGSIALVVKPEGQCVEPNIIGDSRHAEYILFWDGREPQNKGTYAIIPVGAKGENAYCVSEDDNFFCKGHLFVSDNGDLFRLRVSGEKLILSQILVSAD